MQKQKVQQINSSVDIAKLVMAILVVGIHTEPFHANIWLDRGFGLLTRLCVPFFFITSAYFFFKGRRSLKNYLGRIILLYVFWSLIYLPFDFSELNTMSLPQILRRYLWDGNEHALWYLQGSVIGVVIVYGLRKILSLKAVCIISFVLLVVGCVFSTYIPLVERLGGVLES